MSTTVDGVKQGAAGATDAGSVSMAALSGSTDSTVQHLQDIFHSAGQTRGGLVTDAGSNTVDMALGTGLIRATNSPTAQLLFFDFAQELGLSVPLDTTRYIGIEYNAGSPQAIVSATNNFDSQTTFHQATCVNDGGEIHISNTPHAVGDHATNMILRSHETMGVQRDDITGGLILTETGTRNLILSAGNLWDRLSKFSVSAIDTSAAGTYDRYFATAPGVFTKQAGVTTWNNTEYNDGSSLVTLGVSKWATQWFYLELNGELLSMYGTVQHNSLADAEDEQPPADVPDRISLISILIGRLIFKKSEGTAQTIESAFDVTFGGANVTDHGSLGGLSDDDHPQYLKDIVDDTTPQLGGGLDGQDNLIENVESVTVGQNDSTLTLSGTAFESSYSSHEDGLGNLLQVLLQRANDSAAVAPWASFVRSRNTIAAPAAVQDNDQLGALLALGFDGTDYEQGAQIVFAVDGTPGNNDMPAEISLRCSPSGATVPVEVVSVKPDGSFLFAQEIATPATPASGDNKIYFKTDARLYTLQDDGRERLLSHETVVEANTAVSASPNVITESESGKTFTNEGATAENHHDLPAAAANLQYTFIVQDTDGIQVNAVGDDTIRVAGSVSAAAGLIEATAIGSTITLLAINATEWVAISLMGGPWTVT